MRFTTGTIRVEPDGMHMALPGLGRLKLHESGGARGIDVCTVLPATIDTPLFQHAANYTGRAVLAMPPVYPPERVARTIVNLVRLPRREAVVGTMGRALVAQSRLTPGRVERPMAVQVDRKHLSRDQPARPAPETCTSRPPAPAEPVAAGPDRRMALRGVGAAAALLTWAVAAGRPMAGMNSWQQAELTRAAGTRIHAAVLGAANAPDLVLCTGWLLASLFPAAGAATRAGRAGGRSGLPGFEGLMAVQVDRQHFLQSNPETCTNQPWS
ncbi:hypothetical protein RMN56_22590 [Micromonospora halotolerans]|uniref:Uncharacterized protein n=1 Tax=Micromonospora halotolerans TaxID=709879 RepID=A0ABY9ZTJ2_9ACTN|nr:hypothetical protein [Micromonospora halotolerans]WNM37920.1 hypothetical protein RMN56_22590 [Micromonospora halotolerans]